MNRTEWLLNGLGPQSKIMEIGPSFAPLAPRSKGWNTTIVDHASRDRLIEKYRGNPDAEGCIEDVDIILTGQDNLDDYFQSDAHESYDAVINSHVIEHMPNPIGFFISCSRMLNEVGTLRMAVPDKKRCFDYFRPFTSTGQLLEAHARRSVVHSQSAVFDAVAYAAFKDGLGAWADGAAYESMAFAHSLKEAKAWFDRSADKNAYLDFHGWCFTPSSFSLAILELSHIGAIDFRIADITGTLGPEFLVKMERGRPIKS
jgi:predicted SAM-dependent methyltransferase